jgi:hypothetical protein
MRPTHVRCGSFATSSVKADRLRLPQRLESDIGHWAFRRIALEVFGYVDAAMSSAAEGNPVAIRENADEFGYAMAR